MRLKGRRCLPECYESMETPVLCGSPTCEAPSETSQSARLRPRGAVRRAAAVIGHQRLAQYQIA
jgi:hypothetical protein